MLTLNNLLYILAVLGCGLMAGVFFAFSVFIMKALSRLPAREGIAAMQAINIAVVNPVFLLIFLGTALANIFVVVLSLLSWQEPSAPYLFIGSSLYLVGSFLVTIVFNIPKNDALAAISPTDPASSKQWVKYLATWTTWNHIRAVASLAATLFFTLAFVF
jgi:uncharacterized membrane protein